MLYFGFNGHPGSIDKRFKYGLVCYEDSEVGTIQFINLDCNIVSIKSINNNSSINCYYDNANRSIEVNFDGIDMNYWKLSLVNISGQVILSSPLNNVHNRISVSRTLNNGIYFVRILDKMNGNLFVKKIFIQ